MLIPDRLPSLVLLVGCWVPPAVAGWAAAAFAHQRTPRLRPVAMYAMLAILVVAWAAAWFVFQLDRIPPYVPGATEDPRYAPPEAVRGLLVVASALVLPVSALACWLAFRSHGRSLSRSTPARA